MASKRKLSAMSPEAEEPVDPSDELMFLCLGGGNEVGRSCHIIKYKDKTVMLDAGMHPGYDGLSALPFFDEFDLSTVDILLISHCHIDHAAGLPYVLSKTNFRGRVFMTHSTKAIYKWLIQDSVRVGNTSSSSEQHTQLYTEADHLSTFPQIEAFDYYTTHTISSVRVTPYPAGHILGAAMFLIEIAGLKILFTGDYSRENDRHLIPAEVPKNVKVDVLITESTYGNGTHSPRLEREAALMKSITGILNRGGRALLPVFALGRAQELLLILDEYWAKHPEYQKVPIYYASNLARKCMVVYQTYIGAMNDNIKRLFRERMAEAEASGSSDANRGGPWDFKYIRSLKTLERFDDVGSCVMLASPGMMQSGVSRELLERWAPDQRNGVVITGYSVEGTMAKHIGSEPEMIQAVMTAKGGGGAVGKNKAVPGKEGEQVMIPRRCTVQEFSFAAHVDGRENREFIEMINAPVVILVHGEKTNMTRLKSRLLSLNTSKPADQKIKIFSPANCEEVRIPIRTEKIAKVVGKLAERINIPRSLALTENGEEDGTGGKLLKDGASGGQLITGVLVQNDLKLSLMDPDDLREYAGLTTTTITCRQKLTVPSAGIELIRWALEVAFGGIRDLSEHTNGIREEKEPKVANGEEAANGHDPAVKAEDHEVADEEIERPEYKFLVMDTVTVTYSGQGDMQVEWEGNLMNDGIADAVLSILMGIESSPAAVKQSSKQHSHAHSHSDAYEPNGTSNPPHKPSLSLPAAASTPSAARLDRLLLLLETHFGTDAVTPLAHRRPAPNGAAAKPDLDAPASPEEPAEAEAEAQAQAEVHAAESARLAALGLPVAGLALRADGHDARIWLEDLTVEAAHAPLRERLKRVVARGSETAAGLAGVFEGGVRALSAAAGAAGP